MKKFFLFAAALFAAVSMNAQDPVNLFDASTTTLETWFASGDSWNPETESTGNYNDGTVTLHIAVDKAGQWRAQVKLHTVGITLDAAKNYKFSCKINTNVALGGVTVKVFNDSELSYTPDYDLVAGDNNIVTKTFGGGNTGDGIIVLDFGYALANTDIVISEIKLFESAEVVLPDPKPEAAPAVPTLDADTVLSIYSNTYNAAKAFGFCEGWGQSTTLEELSFEGNTVLYYKKFNYLGWACQTGAIDASKSTKLHLDIWSPADEASIDVYPIYGGEGLTTNDAVKKKVALVAGWNSIDLDLVTDFNGLDFSSIFQFKFADGVNLPVFALDNVYFYGKKASTAIENNAAEANVVKAVRNGQVVIIRNGVEYSVMGAQIR